MNESAPQTTGEPAPAEDAATPARDRAGSAGRADLLVHLEALHELQTALSQEERDDEILRVGTTAAVEILGADSGLAMVRSDDGSAPLRFGWREGSGLAQHEIEVLARNLETHLKSVRQGETTRVVLATDPAEGEVEVDGEPSGALQSRGFGSILILSLGKGGGRLGELILGRRDPAPFSPEQLLLAEILALQFAVQVERVRRTSEARDASDRTRREVESATRPLRERNQELESLNAVAAVVSPSFELERQLDQILKRAAEVTGHEGGAIYLVETEADGEERLRLARLLDERLRTGAIGTEGMRPGEGLAGRVWQSETIVALADLRSDPDAAAREDLVHAGFHGILMAPLRARGRIVGVLELVSREERFYLDDEQHLAQAIADQVGLMIQNSRLLSDLMHHSLDLEGRAERSAREIDRRAHHAGAVHGVIRGVAGREDLETTLVSALESVLDLLGAEVGAVHLLDPRTGAPLRKAQCGMPEQVEAMEAALHEGTAARRAVETGEFQVNERPGGGRDSGAERPALEILVVVPLTSMNRVIGLLTLASMGPVEIGEEERTCLRSLGAVIGMAIELRAGRPGGGAGGDGGAPPSGILPAGLVQAQKLESIGTLAGGIAHDFNNIVGAVLGYATHIKTLVPEDNPIHRYVSIIEKQSQRGCDLTRQLLAFARGGERSRQPVDVSTVVEETVALLSRSVGADIALEVHTDPDLPAVEADPVQMKQVLLNLAVNAKDAMPNGGRITFETRAAHLDRRFVEGIPDLPPGDYVTIVIGDSGVGMRPEVMERMFEPFFTTKPDGLGSGLGLAVVYGVVKGHGGHVAIDSTPGIGTTVRLYFPPSSRPASSAVAAAHPEVPAPDRPPPVIPLPRERRATGGPQAKRRTERGDVEAPEREPADGRATAPAAQATEAEAGSTEPVAATATAAPPAGAAVDPAGADAADESGARKDEGTGVRVMVVDDEEALRDLARDILESRGHEVIVAHDGVEALDVYRREWGRITLVLLDMVMPRLGGLETFRRLMGMDRRLRVLLCSGYSQNEQAQTAIREGAVGLLPKPYTMSELLAWVDKISRREARST